jgi:hypothetical protein
LQSHTTLACNHVPNNQVAFQQILQPQITFGCNHARKTVANTHWFNSFFCSHKITSSVCNDTHKIVFCNHKRSCCFCNHTLLRLAIIYQITKITKYDFVI